eukprot:9236229-Prorocentrum_lima.AAC.1
MSCTLQPVCISHLMGDGAWVGSRDRLRRPTGGVANKDNVGGEGHTSMMLTSGLGCSTNRPCGRMVFPRGCRAGVGSSG